MAENEIAAKLDTLIRLQAHLAIAGLSSQKEKILFLGRAGLLPKEIADILGTTSNNVSVQLSAARKAGTLKRLRSASIEGDTDGKE